VARALGAGRPAEAQHVAEHAFALTAVMAVVLTASMLALERPIFRAMGASGEVLETALDVARILFGGLIVGFFVGTCDSVLRGAGNVRIPAMCATLSLVAQIALTPILMFALGWGIRGAPAATIAGQLIGAVPRLPHLFGRGAAVRARLWPGVVRAAPLAAILRVGVPASLGTLINYLGMIALTGVMARFGTAELAAYGLCSRFDFVLLTICYGTGIAVLTLVGFASGAGRPQLVRAYARRAVLLLATVIAVPTVLLWCWPQLWLGLFTDDAAILATGQRYFRIIGLTYPLMGISMTLAFAFQGIGRALMPLVIGALRVTVIVAGAVWLTAGLAAGFTSVFVLVSAASFAATALLGAAFLRLPHERAMER
jgi:putative MATE family efflux protein